MLTGGRVFDGGSIASDRYHRILYGIVHRTFVGCSARLSRVPSVAPAPRGVADRSDRNLHIESLTLTNFRCFGAEPVTIEVENALTVFVGANGTGKTAAFDALARMFGVTRRERQVVREDFHAEIQIDENDGEHQTDSDSDADVDKSPACRELSIEVVLAFPELALEPDDQADPLADGAVEDLPEIDAGVPAVSEFFRHMAATVDGELKCRFRLEATWTDDGSVDGTVEESFIVIRSFEDEYSEDDCHAIGAIDRSRIQMVYVPASRDGAEHLTAFLRSRLWKAALWTDGLRSAAKEAADDLNEKFRDEPVVATVEQAVSKRWKHLHRGTFDADPSFHPIERDLTQLVNRAQLLFTPSEQQHGRRAEQLSDGQRSLLQIALTAATVDVEGAIASGANLHEFDSEAVQLPPLTLLVVEEPENSLSPQFLSRIISQMLDIGGGSRAQALISSQSASVLGRVDPRVVRHFRLDHESHRAVVNRLDLPADAHAEAKYVREAVRAFPELYFARFVVLGEGGSEEVVIPRVAEAAGTMIDQSFVAVVPLGGRHVNHFWRLLSGLGIPYVTLLDLDLGRTGGGEGRLRTACKELEKIGVNPLASLDQFECSDGIAELDEGDFDAVVRSLEENRVVFCAPLDLDMTMLTAYPEAYRIIDEGQNGPATSPAHEAVLGVKGDGDLYGGWDDEFRWYRYLFLGRSKPSTHLRALQALDNGEIAASTPDPLQKIIEIVADAVG